MDKKYSFSGGIYMHTAEGPPEDLTYNIEYHRPSSWDKTTYCVPTSGLYCFTVSFVRDSNTVDGKTASNDDCEIQICVNGVVKAAAWAGQSANTRQPATVTVILPLDEGDKVKTRDKIDSDATNTTRRFYNCVFTGFRLD